MTDQDRYPPTHIQRVKVTIEVYVDIDAIDETRARNGALSRVTSALERINGYKCTGRIETKLA